MKLFYFEKLEVWQKSRKLTTEMYRMTASFPAEEKFGMTSQIRSLNKYCRQHCGRNLETH